MLDRTVTPEFLQGEEYQVLEGNGEEYEEREVASDVAATETEDEDGDEIIT